ncbi:hypothetical protein TNCV_3991141 [Trichonephila clavipes]|uniref:Uncharacterized protein n=1 Tax=Trichonephila clavipes TaxID=2585209 RepID=A0A8X6SZX7_TRICX|nr:hypothetical protein TNCV_3991141 [Trichonephila clavipes]
MQWLLCVLTWIRGRPNATVMVVNVTMKRERSFICPQDVLKTHVGSCSILEKAHFTNASSVRYLLAKWYGYSWRIQRRILRTDDGGKPNRLAASRALLVPETASDTIASFRQQCRVLVLLSSMVVRLVLDPPAF